MTVQMQTSNILHFDPEKAINAWLVGTKSGSKKAGVQRKQSVKGKENKT